MLAFALVLAACGDDDAVETTDGPDDDSGSDDDGGSGDHRGSGDDDARDDRGSATGSELRRRRHGRRDHRPQRRPGHLRRPHQPRRPARIRVRHRRRDRRPGLEQTYMLEDCEIRSIFKDDQVGCRIECDGRPRVGRGRTAPRSSSVR